MRAMGERFFTKSGSKESATSCCVDRLVRSFASDRRECIDDDWLATPWLDFRWLVDDDLGDFLE